jgi:hypothetical protein
VSITDAQTGTANWLYDAEVKDWVFGLYQFKALVEGRPGLAPVVFTNQECGFSAVVTLPKTVDDVAAPDVLFDLRETSSGRSLLVSLPCVWVLGSALYSSFALCSLSLLLTLNTG